MQYIKLGNTGLTAPRLWTGTRTFVLQTDEDTLHAILNADVNAGITLLDTTGVCPLAQAKSRVGRIEQIIGRWLAGRRHQFIVAIKAVGKVGPAPWD